MTPEEQWTQPFLEPPGPPTIAHERDLVEMQQQFHFLTKLLMDKLPPGHARTNALTKVQEAYLWGKLAVEVYRPKES